MLITYRRTGGVFALIAVAAVALAATVATAVVAALVLMLAVAGAAALFLARGLLPRSWRQRGAMSATGGGDVIEGTVVKVEDDRE